MDGNKSGRTAIHVKKPVGINQTVIVSILEYAKACYPNEGILLLKGKRDKQRIIAEEVEIPPIAVHGRRFSNFPLYMLPIDFSVVGTAHSHPSGVPKPSVVDLNNFYGRIMVIAVFPYSSERDISVFDREGSSVNYEIIDDR